jgi:hypothetical protein
LVTHRLAQRLQRVFEEKIRLLEQQNAELQRTISAQESYLVLLSLPVGWARATPAP